MLTPVEKMAVRLLERHALIPPYDLNALVVNYATVEYLNFPFSADGISISAIGQAKPQILINNNNQSETRLKFTLAHELGHLIIPWHTGLVVSSHTQYSLNAHTEYKELESEANEFAAELLIPSKWLIDIFLQNKNFEDFLNYVVKNTGASRDAILIKVFKTLDEPIVCVEINSFGMAINIFKAKKAPHSFSISNTNLLQADPFSTALSKNIFSIGDKRYIAWTFGSLEVQENDNREWRIILNEILMDCDSQTMQLSINAILASSFQRNKEKTIDEIFTFVMHSFDGRLNMKKIVGHLLFKQYVYKRVKELKAKQS